MSLLRVEVLARIVQNDQLYLPHHFLPVAEDYGYLDEITERVLEQFCMQVAKWHTTTIDTDYSINLSPSYLRSGDPAGYLSSKLSKYDISPKRVTIEINEGLLALGYQPILETLNRLRLKGHELSIDHFGVGNLTKKHLANIPCGELKIDLGFIHQLDQTPNDTCSLTRTGKVANELNLNIVAEGIESQTQLDSVLKSNICFGQGYYLAKPMDAVHFENWYLKHSLGEFK